MHSDWFSEVQYKLYTTCRDMYAGVACGCCMRNIVVVLEHTPIPTLWQSPTLSNSALSNLLLLHDQMASLPFVLSMALLLVALPLAPQHRPGQELMGVSCWWIERHSCFVNLAAGDSVVRTTWQCQTVTLPHWTAVLRNGKVKVPCSVIPSKCTQ